jgi:hypothetical protein
MAKIPKIAPIIAPNKPTIRYQIMVTSYLIFRKALVADLLSLVILILLKRNGPSFRIEFYRFPLSTFRLLSSPPSSVSLLTG